MGRWVNVWREVHPQFSLHIVQLDVFDAWVSGIVVLDVSVRKRILFVVQVCDLASRLSHVWSRFLNEEVLLVEALG